MAFTVTTLSWAAIFYKAEFEATKEMGNIQDAIRWGTDYFLKASSKRNILYVEVGDPAEDHHCWAPPEKMKTKRSVKLIDGNTPGSEIAAETAAAMASSSIVFRHIDRKYARRLLNKAKLVWNICYMHMRFFFLVTWDYENFFSTGSFSIWQNHIKEHMMENALSTAPIQAITYVTTFPYLLSFNN